ncbi:MAG: hypothetical protein BAJALOKI1v1_1210006 [Promethearchaeota archaeon]|nr:MAG: hypothetical protein BAJALOKI1v1_1210006 [Candidatus Lokiarchaeota archaeon]
MKANKNMIEFDNKKKASKDQLAELFFSIANPEEACHLKGKRKVQKEKEKTEEFEKYLEVCTIWFQSILGLKTSPSTGTSDNRKMAGISMEKLINKVDEFHSFISENKKYLPCIPNKIDLYSKYIIDNPDALRILASFRNIANRNLTKLNLIMSDFKLLLQKIEANDNGSKTQNYLKIQDALLKLMILLHQPINDVFSRFS